MEVFFKLCLDDKVDNEFYRYDWDFGVLPVVDNYMSKDLCAKIFKIPFECSGYVSFVSFDLVDDKICVIIDVTGL